MRNLERERELAELDAEFARTDSEMTPNVFAAKRGEILARPSRDVREEEAARKANEVAEKDARFAKWGQVKEVLLAVTKNVVIQKLFAPLRARVSKLEAKIDVVPTAIAIPFKEYSQKFDELGTRVANLEMKCGALALSLGRSNPEGAVELEALVKRLRALEERPTLRYRGTWNPETQSNEGDVLTFQGSAWFCNRATRSRPGTNDDFTLMVKRGKDARVSEPLAPGPCFL